MTVTQIRPRSAEEVTREAAQQLGFAWHCMKTSSEGQCDEAGNDRAEYAAHMKGHGRKQIHGAPKIRLKATPPGATLAPLPCLPFKFITWTQRHVTPGVCTCGHFAGQHRYRRSLQGNTWECGQCDCTPATLPEHTTQMAVRRGQFWAHGPRAKTVWVMPFDAAPWQGKREPELVRVERDGTFSQTSL